MAVTPSVGWLVALSATRLLCGLAVVKVLSVLLGPAEFGRVTQVMGICAMIYSFAGGAITNGIVRHAGVPDLIERQKWLDAALVVGCIAALIIASGTILFWRLGLGRLLLGGADLGLVLLGIGAAQFAIGFSNILLAHSSGTGDTKTFAATNIAGTLSCAIIVITTALSAGGTAAVWGVAIAPITTAIACLFFLKTTILACKGVSKRFEWTMVTDFIPVSFWMIIAIMPLPLAHAFVRADLSVAAGWTDVGIWQAVARLSDAYMQVFGLLVVNLLLPRLVAEKPGRDRMQKVKSFGAATLLLFVAGAAVLNFAKFTIFPVAFSQEFVPATAFVASYLMADFIKVAGWLLVYKMIADGHYWAQPLAEVIQAIGFVGGYVALRATYGGSAPIYGHLVSCLIMFAALVVVARKYRL